MGIPSGVKFSVSTGAHVSALSLFAFGSGGWTEPGLAISLVSNMESMGGFRNGYVCGAPAGHAHLCISR